MSVFDYTVDKSNGEEFPLSEYKGEVLLIVNTATKCGFANQFDGLEELHQSYKDDGLRVLGFPSNQFMSQEPVPDDQMEESCRLNFGVTFPLFKKIDVKGKQADPLYKHLKEQQGGVFGDEIKWNFTKFLVDREGQVVKRFAPKDKPKDIEASIKELL
ncbi:glutathione peroxidase family protein [Geomicrobium sp. JCM 19037]|uniref:glutathione peroxidase n=1 Tax=unclassified Geomicrobium TaxID=2628951 RepID=UPI00045F4336|nr:MULTISPECIES: glutathione peroxidase [unclassified Geomicrobium]GAK03962.1 glutathione peroxidase family protein [Geomicrobium sp. JCM 19037]GAK13559.1 glutathione peroxidase family protein [Geomicrobium sp. JCM 19039]